MNEFLRNFNSESATDFPNTKQSIPQTTKRVKYGSIFR